MDTFKQYRQHTLKSWGYYYDTIYRKLQNMQSQNIQVLYINICHISIKTCMGNDEQNSHCSKNRKKETGRGNKRAWVIFAESISLQNIKNVLCYYYIILLYHVIEHLSAGSIRNLVLFIASRLSTEWRNQWVHNSIYLSSFL